MAAEMLASSSLMGELTLCGPRTPGRINRLNALHTCGRDACYESAIRVTPPSVCLRTTEAVGTGAGKLLISASSKGNARALIRWRRKATLWKEICSAVARVPASRFCRRAFGILLINSGQNSLQHTHRLPFPIGHTLRVSHRTSRSLMYV